MKVYVVQELSDDDVPNAKVYASPGDAAQHAEELANYCGLETDDGRSEPGFLSDWNGEEIDLRDDEGRVIIRLYATDVS